MDKYSYVSNANPEFIEDVYNKYKESPDSVDEKWRSFFEGFDFYEVVSKNGGVLHPRSIIQRNFCFKIN